MRSSQTCLAARTVRDTVDSELAQEVSVSLFFITVTSILYKIYIYSHNKTRQLLFTDCMITNSHDGSKLSYSLCTSSLRKYLFLLSATYPPFS